MYNNKLLGLVYGAFIGDAIALGPHWIYDTKVIATHYHPITGYTNPSHTPYHGSKKAGDFTHYGDQSLVLLKSLSVNNGFYLEKFKADWFHLMTHNELYLDHATKVSMPILSDAQTFTGSDSDELGGFSRSAPLFLLKDITNADFNLQTGMTHNNPLLLDISGYFIDVIMAILNGSGVIDALELNLKNSSEFIKASYSKALAQQGSIVEAVGALGQSCSSQFGLPSVLNILLNSSKHEMNFKETLIENVYAGGDSASRGLLLGMVLGAYWGFDQLPIDWIDGLNQKEAIDTYLVNLGYI